MGLQRTTTHVSALQTNIWANHYCGISTSQQDMHNLRLAAAFLQKTELKFDLVSAVDELSAQLKLEFDFEREARVMDAVSRHLMVRRLSLLTVAVVGAVLVRTCHMLHYRC